MKKNICEYDSFYDCHSNKEFCKKHFRISGISIPKPKLEKIDQLSDSQTSELDHDMWAGRGKM